ncbi:MAG: LysM peptidoglycan-binding domain-containing protein [Opitutaceae bacterium]|nr:LysM peptidoglycan-binding domain-containing protein [Opitutaceae bacterium]
MPPPRCRPRSRPRPRSRQPSPPRPNPRPSPAPPPPGPPAKAPGSPPPPLLPRPLLPTGPRTHTVAEGENLSIIAFKYYQSPNKWDKIVAANRGKLKNPDQVRPGMVLVIP